MIERFVDLFEDCTRQGRKVKTDEYQEVGKYIIVDQGQNNIVGYTDEIGGVYEDVPAIVFGDHTRVIKYIDKPFFLGADGVKLLKCKRKNANYKYLYYALKNAKIPNTGYNRHYKWLKEIKIMYPNPIRQQRIVDVLDKIENIMLYRKNEIDKIDELIKSRFVEMFGDPVNNPKGWEKRNLADEADIRIGPFGTLLHKEDYISGGHALVNPSHIVDGKIVIDDNLTISDEKYMELRPYHLEKGDVIMGRRGEMGRCAVVDRSGLLCGTGSLFIRTKGELSADYIQKILSFPSFKMMIEDMAVGQTMPNLNVPIVSAFQIIKPSASVQKEYYTFVAQVNKSKAAVQKSLDETQLLFDSLMQQYFG